MPSPKRQSAQPLSLQALQAKPEADPVVQLFYSVLHARRALDRLDQAIRHHAPRKANTPDPLFFTPVGKSLFEYQHHLRTQLGSLAKQYISLGIEERQTRVIEDWSNILLPFVTNLLDDPDLALNRRQRAQIPMVVERHLRALERPDS